MEYFANKTIWITGASSGIGASMAISLSGMNANLILTARNLKKLKQVKNQCKSPEKVSIHRLDMSDLDSVNDVFRKVLIEAKTIDMLVNNAGVSQRSTAVKTSFETDEEILLVNYRSVIKLSKLCLHHFVDNNSGHFVIMSSTTGKVGIPLRSSYSASKHALHGYFESLRAELAESGISITIICPASIKTDISKNALVGDGSTYSKMDSAQNQGMPIEIFTKKSLSAIARKKPEVSIGTFRESTLVLFLWRFFPNLFRRIIGKAKVT